jgi:hypothetical protein
MLSPCRPCVRSNVRQSISKLCVRADSSMRRCMHFKKIATTERAMFVGGVLAVLSAATGAPSASVYWVSSPTLVNETLLVAGAGTCAVD